MSKSRARIRAEQYLEDALYQPIVVLVWGPGDPGINASDEKRIAYQKRLQIRDEIRDKFTRAEVYFSEDKEMEELSKGIPGQLMKEALQAIVVDLVIMLDISRGADLELDYFASRYSWFRDRVHIFLPERYLPPQGLIADLLKDIPADHIEGFSQADFDNCTVATKMAIRATHGAAMGHLLWKLDKNR